MRAGEPKQHAHRNTNQGAATPEDREREVSRERESSKDYQRGQEIARESSREGTQGRLEGEFRTARHGDAETLLLHASGVEHAV
eukprot:6149624-Pleurochrysis_carterae.AAC.2